MIDININITLKDKKLLNDIKYKYHISYSTIANTIIYPMMLLCGENLHKDLYKNEKNYKSHIKPNTRWENIKGKEYTNALKIFLRKEYDKYKKEGYKNEDYIKVKQNLLNKIYNMFQNTYEENWDGNREARSITRFIKKNPKYCKKLLKVD